MALTTHNASLRVLHVLHALDTGGMENGVVNMARKLESRGIIADVCCLTSKGSFAARLPESSTVYELRKPGHFSVTTAWRLRRLLADHSPDVVHAHNWCGLVYSVLSGYRGASLVQGEHGQLTPWQLTPKRLALRRWLYAACAGVHTVSEGQKDELIELGLVRPGQVHALINGVDTDYFHPHDQEHARESLGLPGRGVFLGIVARCIPEKRHDLALEAFRAIASNRPEVHLLLAGEGGTIRDQILSAVRTHPYCERIHWLGQCGDMRSVYQAMDLLVVPSAGEGLSNACLESMATAVPVLANGTCGAVELVTEGVTGLIRPIREANDLTDGIEEALGDLSKLRAMGQAAREDVVKRFSIEAMADRYEQMYHSLAAERKRPARASNLSPSRSWIS